MNRTVIGLLAFFIGIIAPSVVWAHSLLMEVQDKYLASKGITVYDSPVIQTNLVIDLPKGFYIGLFWSKSADSLDFTNNFGDEVDYTIGWLGNMKGLRLDFGVSYFDTANVFSTKGGDAVSPYLQIEKDVILDGRNTLIPYIRTEAYIPVGKWNGDAHVGAHMYAGIKHQWRLHELLILHQKFAVMYDTGTFVASDHGFLGHYNVNASWKINNALSIGMPTFKLTFPISHLNDGRGVEHVVGASLNFKF